MSKISRILLFAATATVACVGQTEAPAETWPERMTVVVEKGEGEGSEQELKITLTPIEGWSINTAYPGVKVDLAEKTPVEKRELKKADGVFEDEKPGDKAARAIFQTTLKGKAPSKVEGTYKAVICTKAACSPPFTGTFSEIPVPAKTPEPADK